MDHSLANLLSTSRAWFQYRLHGHFASQNDLFAEIQLANRFWSQYLNSIHLINSCAICYMLYIVVLTDTMMFFKIYFVVISIMQAFVIIVCTVLASNLFDSVHRYYGHYVNLMVYDSRYRVLDLHLKIKVGLPPGHCSIADIPPSRCSTQW